MVHEIVVVIVYGKPLVWLQTWLMQYTSQYETSYQYSRLSKVATIL